MIKFFAKSKGMSDNFPSDLTRITHNELSNLKARYSAKRNILKNIEDAVDKSSSAAKLLGKVHSAWPHRASRCALNDFHDLIGYLGVFFEVFEFVYSFVNSYLIQPVNDRIELIIAEIQRRRELHN